MMMLKEIKRDKASMSSLISISALFATLTIASGNLPKILLGTRKVQIALLKDSQASSWPKAMVPSKFFKEKMN